MTVLMPSSDNIPATPRLASKERARRRLGGEQWFRASRAPALPPLIHYYAQILAVYEKLSCGTSHAANASGYRMELGMPKICLFSPATILPAIRSGIA